MPICDWATISSNTNGSTIGPASTLKRLAGEENKNEEQRAEATLKLGICLYEARNFGKSFQVMREVIEKFPVSPQVNEAYYYIGLGHFQLGHYSRAIQALEKVGTTFPTIRKG